MPLKGFIPYRKEDAEKYNRLRWWRGITFGDLLDKAADLYPNKEALVDNTSRFTYSQLREKANRLAISFMELGIKPQERVILQLPNWSEYVCAYFAIQKIGAIAIPSIARHAQTEIAHLGYITGATTWVVPEKFRKTDYLPIIDYVVKTNPDLRRVILVRSKDNRRFLNLEKLIERGDLSEANLQKLADRRPDPMEVAHLAPTGGTTGIPKVAPRTHNDYICRTEYLARAWELCSSDRCLAVIPIGHDACFSILVCPTIFSCGKVVMLDSTEPADILETIQKEQITIVAGVPPLYRMLVDFEDLKRYDVSSLQRIYCGGQATPAELVKDVIERLGCKFINAYGGTEGMSTMTRLDYDPAIIHTTVGKPTCPYSTYKVIDGKEKELPPNTVGELAVKGPDVFSGYFNSLEENEKTFTEDGFFRSGDQARIDESGNVTITGRLKDIVKRGGENISPVEIEGLIITHPGVEAVAVVGMPDKDMGERVCAYVQPKPGVKLNFEEIISFLKGKGASVLQLPERIEFIASMPLINVKIDKEVLREDIRRKLLAEGILSP